VIKISARPSGETTKEPNFQMRKTGVSKLSNPTMQTRWIFRVQIFLVKPNLEYSPSSIGPIFFSSLPLTPRSQYFFRLLPSSNTSCLILSTTTFSFCTRRSAPIANSFTSRFHITFLLFFLFFHHKQPFSFSPFNSSIFSPLFQGDFFLGKKNPLKKPPPFSPILNLCTPFPPFHKLSLHRPQTLTCVHHGIYNALRGCGL